jgi:PAS domain S-box-containing protein
MDDHAIVGADASGVIQLWSNGAEKLFGYASAQAVGRSLDLIVPEQYRNQHWNGFRNAMANGSSKLDGQSTEIPVKCRDGAMTVFKGAFMLLRNADKKVIGAMVIFNR